MHFLRYTKKIPLAPVWNEKKKKRKKPSSKIKCQVARALVFLPNYKFEENNGTLAASRICCRAGACCTFFYGNSTEFLQVGHHSHRIAGPIPVHRLFLKKIIWSLRGVRGCVKRTEIGHLQIIDTIHWRDYRVCESFKACKIGGN